MSKRRIRRDLHKRVASAGYQQIAGDLEVRGRILGPTVTNLASGVGALSAITTTPVQLAAPTAQGSMRSITLNWSRQYTLSNFSHYEIQVSEDDLYWYSPRMDGSDWRDELNADLDVRIEYFNHPNIPLVQDGGDLVGKKLYYRVRQATMAGVKSPWSASCNATTKPVNDLVLTDSYNRYIEISSHKGIYADDRQGHIIHDIPDAPILSGMVYGGHLIWVAAASAAGGIDERSSSAAVSWAATSAIQNINLSGKTGGCQNVKGALVALYCDAYMAAGKVQAGSTASIKIRYCKTYNDATDATYQVSAGLIGIATATPPGAWEVRNWSNALLPVVFDAGVPYLSILMDYNFAGMTANAAERIATTYLYLVGFLV